LVMIRDAVRAGAGAARLPLSLVLSDIASGRMTYWGDVAGSDISLWALYPSRRLLSARVSAFLEFLRHSFPQGAPEELAAYPAE
ncbi:MAG: LysR family transcriptional regulator, partial [Sphingomonas sp.]